MTREEIMQAIKRKRGKINSLFYLDDFMTENGLESMQDSELFCKMIKTFLSKKQISYWGITLNVEFDEPKEAAKYLNILLCEEDEAADAQDWAYDKAFQLTFKIK